MVKGLGIEGVFVFVTVTQTSGATGATWSKQVYNPAWETYQTNVSVYRGPT